MFIRIQNVIYIFYENQELKVLSWTICCVILSFYFLFYLNLYELVFLLISFFCLFNWNNLELVDNHNVFFNNVCSCLLITIFLFEIIVFNNCSFNTYCYIFKVWENLVKVCKFSNICFQNKIQTTLSTQTLKNNL